MSRSIPHAVSSETANIVTHGLGFALSLAATVYLMSLAGREGLPTVAACGLYCATLILTYGASTLSHVVWNAAWRTRLRMLDQASIFLLIAGSFTPLAEVHLQRGAWWLLLVAMWSLAVIGVLRVIWHGDSPRRNMLAYVGLGLLPGVAFGELLKEAPPVIVFWMAIGGLCYLTGLIFLGLSRTFRYAHAAWHVFVMAGSASHYFANLVAITHPQ